jgi:hypothetical protein
MLSLNWILAVAAEPQGAEQLPQHPGIFHGDGGSHDVFLIIGLGLLIALVLFFVVYQTRGKRARRNGVVRSSRVLYKQEPSSREASSGRVKIRKRRKSHPDNLPRNPTLGETGGLPPLRPENPSEPVA